MSLPYDIARCHGNGSPACEDCQRRTAPWGEWQPVVAPHATEDGCELQIEHDRKGRG